jgi:hypothetical protein
MELDEIKYLYLLLYYHYLVLFFSIPIESKKSSANLGFRIDKKTKSPSVLNLFLVVILLVYIDFWIGQSKNWD